MKKSNKKACDKHRLKLKKCVIINTFLIIQKGKTPKPTHKFE